MKRKRILIVSALLLAAGLAAEFYWWPRPEQGRGGRDERGGRRADQSVTVARSNLCVRVSTTGLVQPQNRLEIRPPIPGRVEAVLAREGQSVRRGQILSWISSTERAALLDAARAKGEKELTYWESLYKPAPIVAPLDGDIIARNVEPGQTITAAEALFVLSDRLIVQAKVDETDIGRIALTQAATLTLDAYPKETVTGTVDSIAFEAKTVNNVTMYMVDILPERIPPFYRSGMTANIEILTTMTNGVLVVPTEAIGTETNRLFVRMPGAAGAPPRTRIVTTGATDGKYTEVTAGLNEGDTVLVSSVVLPSAKGPGGSNPFMPFARGRR